MMTVLSQREQYQLTIDYMSHLIGVNQDITQACLAAQYGVSQGTVARCIKQTTYMLTAVFMDEYRKTKSYNNILCQDKFSDLSEKIIKMIITYTCYMATESKASYEKLLASFGLYDFAHSLCGTNANKYAI